MTKYLVQVHEDLYGYDNLQIFRIHLAENRIKLEQCKVFKNESKYVTHYTLLSQSEAQLEVYGEAQNEKIK